MGLDTKRSRQITVASVIVLMATTGCATGVDDQESQVTTTVRPDAEPAGTLTVAGFDASGTAGQTRYNLAAEDLPGVDVNLVDINRYGQDPDRKQPEKAQSPSGGRATEPPDLIYIDRNRIGPLASAGAIRPLDECIATEEVDIGKFLDTAIGQVTFDSTIYGVPEFNHVQLIAANSELLAAADMETADVDGSQWDSIKAAATAMVQRGNDGLEVVGYDTGLPEMLPLWVSANGGALVSDDGRTAMLNTPEVVDALTFAASIYEIQGGYRHVKAPLDSAGLRSRTSQFAAGGLAAMPVQRGYIEAVRSSSPDAPVTVTTFKSQDGYPLSYSSGSAWAIPVDGSDPAAACRFAAAMTHTQTWVAAAEARAAERDESGEGFAGLLTANTEADQQIRDRFGSEAGNNPEALVEATYAANEHSVSLPTMPGRTEFESVWREAVINVLNGEQEPAAALDRAQQKAQSVLDDTWASWDRKKQQAAADPSA